MTRRPRRGCARTARSSLRRPPAPTTACCRRVISSFHPTTRNPWDLSKNPGGSSSGAGAAGAAGYGPLHLGTDIGGSIRLPAGWCGLFGLKPSHGRVPIDPFYLGRVAGPMTRTVDDAALMMATITREDCRDGMSLPHENLDWSDLAIDVKDMRIGLMLDPGCGMPVEDEVRDAVVAAARAFEDAGAHVMDVEPVMNRAMLDGVDDFFRARSWADLASYEPQLRAKILPYILTWAEKGASMTGADAIKGYNQTNEMRKAAARMFGKVDLVLSPTAPVAGFSAEWASPLNDPAAPVRAHRLHRAVEHGREPGGVDQLRVHEGRPADRTADRRPAVCGFAVMKVSKLYETWRGPVTNWPRAKVKAAV